ncbi:MAG: hypothetical protein Q9194_006889 [Teloschistes cf. exilis]
MPRLEDAEQTLLSSGSNLKQRTRNAWDSFSDFALRDNVLEVAVGLMYVGSLLPPMHTDPYPKTLQPIHALFLLFHKRKNKGSLVAPPHLAAAFTTVTTSFVSDILLPPISLLPFFARNLEEKFAVLKPGPNYHSHSPNGGKGEGYNTPKQAKEDGAVVMNYG